jgi:hypothetical protein
MTGSRSATARTARMAFRAIFAWPGMEPMAFPRGPEGSQIAFRRPGCGKGAGPAFPSPPAGDGER